MDRYPLLNPWGREIKIEICGGLGIKIIIKNVRNINLINLKWRAEIRGFVLPKTREGTIPIINESYELKIPVFGFGKGIIRFSLDNSFKTANLIMLGPFVFIYY